jgi:hypothetical protein
MSDFGIVYEADLSVRRYTQGVLSKELIGPLEATTFTVQAENEQKERQALRIGQAGKTRGSFGRTLATKIKLGVNAVDPRMMALILLGSTAALTVAGGSAVAEPVTVKHGIWIKLNNYNITNSTAAIVASVEGTDFEIDEKLGAIMALSTGNLADDSVQSLDYDFGAIAGTRIRIGTESKVDVMLEGPAVNRETGKNARIVIPKVTLTPANELSLLSDDYVTAELDGACLLLDTETADHYIDEEVVYS